MRFSSNLFPLSLLRMAFSGPPPSALGVLQIPEKPIMISPS